MSAQREQQGRRVLVLDNYDSFTYNLVQYLGELGAEVEVVRNDVETVDEMLARKPDRLVVFRQTNANGNGFAAGSPAKFAHWRAQSSVVQDVAAYRDNVMSFAGGGVPEQFKATQASADYFPLFGVPDIRGRAFNAAEDSPNAPKVALVSERLWERRFQRDPKMLGRSLSLSGELCGLGGVLLVFGSFSVRLFTDGSLSGFSVSAGFNGFVFALFGGVNPLWSILS